MIQYLSRVSAQWKSLLNDLVQKAQEQQGRAVVIFDLDSTLFDNRSRQARILSEYGEAQGIVELAGCMPRHWTSGWDMKAAMRACGLPGHRVDLEFPQAKLFWQARFFTSEYCELDTEIFGAARFLQRLRQTGVKIAYLTGRHEAMRPGSIACMRQCGMPLEGQQVRLLMKPTLDEKDDDYKRRAHQEVEPWGEVLAAFDNEPMHINDYAQRFPKAQMFHLATDHSGREVALLDRVLTIPHFEIGG